MTAEINSFTNGGSFQNLELLSEPCKFAVSLRLGLGCVTTHWHHQEHQGYMRMLLSTALL